jgi:DNA-binding response OmpR family regulator
MTADPSKGRRQSKIVIAVDDAPETLAILKASITAAGYMFMGVGSGKECLDLIARVQPRLILLDLQMPEMDGLEACRRIRASRNGRQVPIAFLTASKTTDDVRAGVSAGGNDFIIKPFDLEKLIARIAHWTSRRL